MKENRKLMLVAHIVDHEEALSKLVNECSSSFDLLVDVLCDAIDSNGRVFTFGNGGSSCDSLHFTGELIGAYKQRNKKKVPFTVISLNSNVCSMTAISNDYGYDEIFSRQLLSYGVGPKDVVIGFTTSGRSQNVRKAFEVAKINNAYTSVFTGNSEDSQELSRLCDLGLMVPSRNTPTIQECHTILIHAICDLVERYLVEKASNVKNKS
jgi:D-sedoheptulose 7-phosphate isomerase